MMINGCVLMKENKIEDFEREYYSEIKNFFISKRDLLDLKINPKFLAYEVYLCNTFGDDFAEIDEIDDYNENAKIKVEKISKEKLNDSEFSDIMSDIEQSDFDDNVDKIIHSNDD